MVSRVQSRRTVTTNLTPTDILPGELQFNLTDGQAFMGSAGAAAVPLLATRNFSSTASYPAGAIVMYSGAMYRARAAIVPAAFTASQWDLLLKNPMPPDAAGALVNNGSGGMSYVPSLPSGGGNLSGGLGIYDPTANSTSSLVVSATASTSGAGIAITGNGSTTPTKFLRVINGLFQILNNAYNTAILSLTDAGALTVPSVIANLNTSNVQAAGATVGQALTNKLREHFSVFDFGAVGNGVADDHVSIQAGINYLASIGGGELYFPPGDYAISTGLLIQNSGVKLIGAGRGSFHDVSPYNPGASRLLWTGATDGGSAMVTFKPASASAQKLTDVGLSNIALIGTPAYTSGPSCAYGLLIASCQHSTFDVHTVEFTVAAVAMTTTKCAEASNNEGCTVSTRFRQLNTSGTALQIGGDGVESNTCFCHFPYVYGYINKGIGIDFGDCDNNTLNQVWIDSTTNGGSGQPRSIVFRGQTSSGGTHPAGGARVNTLEHFSGSVHANLVYSEGTETANVTVPAYGNRIDYFDNSNAALTQSTGTGATFFWSGNLNPMGMRDSSLDPNNGQVTWSNGLCQFWGSSGSLGAGSVSTFQLPFSCTKLISVTMNIAGSGSSSTVGGTSNYRVNPNNTASWEFDLYAPVTGYYTWTGIALR